LQYTESVLEPPEFLQVIERKTMRDGGSAVCPLRSLGSNLFYGKSIFRFEPSENALRVEQGIAGYGAEPLDEFHSERHRGLQRIVPVLQIVSCA
jgi:hypothetical protein